MSYIGIGPENNKVVKKYQAFDYALERCLKGTPQEQREFRDMLEDWYYSGNWVWNEEDEEQVVYIIRFSDNTLRSFWGTFAEAEKSARREAEERGLGFVVN